mgnify:CR=1 FL=1
MSQPDAVRSALNALPAIPRDTDGPVFREPWEAQAFAMTIRLYEQGLFTWPEWAAALSAAIKRAQACGDPDTGETYYLHWLDALEQLVAEKNILSASEMDQRRDAWERAARTTPHGMPIVLNRAPAHDHGA